MTDQESFEEWFKGEYDAASDKKEMFCAASQSIAWHAALAWLRSHGDPAAWRVVTREGTTRCILEREPLREPFDLGETFVPLYAAPQPKYVPVDASLRDKNWNHPNDDERADPCCRAALSDRGNDVGQGLDGFWKWGFKAGWNACLKSSSPTPQPAIPDGWQLVPVEPTTEMLAAGDRESDNEEGTYETVFAAMLAAAPELRT